MILKWTGPKSYGRIVHSAYIKKTRLYNFNPLKPNFYIVKLRFTGVYFIFLFLLKNIDCVYSLEPPRRGGSNEYPQSMFWGEIWKISELLSENFQFLVVKFSIYLNRRVFVMNGQTLRVVRETGPWICGFIFNIFTFCINKTFGLSALAIGLP